MICVFFNVMVIFELVEIGEIVSLGGLVVMLVGIDELLVWVLVFVEYFGLLDILGYGLDEGLVVWVM